MPTRDTGTAEKTWYERARFWIWGVALLLACGVAWGALRAEVCENTADIREVRIEVRDMDDDLNAIKQDTAYMRGVLSREFGGE